MVVVQASKLSLANPSLSSLHATSVLFEPSSLSLALMHSDSSFSLYPSLSPLDHPSASLPPPPTVVPAPSSSSAFVLLQNPSSADSRVLFVAAGPYGCGSRILLRFYVLRGKDEAFARAGVVCNQRGLESDDRLGALVDSVHGVAVKLAGSVNFFAMHSLSGSKVWIFAVRLVSDEVVKLMRCSVIEHCKPVFSIGIYFGSLVLGEENGVRVFNLRQLVKGRVRKAEPLQSNSKPNSQRMRFPNGVIGGNMGNKLPDRCRKCNLTEGTSEIACNCGKQRAIRLRADSSEVEACFVSFSSKDIEASKTRGLMSVKANSIQALSQKKFIILDSAGNIHLLCLPNSVLGPDMSLHMQQLPQVSNVQKLAVLADSSIETQTVWVSDGYHSLHMIAASEIETALNESDRNEKEEKLVQISVIRSIFACEKIEDFTPLAANAIVVLGQGPFSPNFFSTQRDEVAYMHTRFPKKLFISHLCSNGERILTFLSFGCIFPVAAMDSKMRPPVTYGRVAEPILLFRFLHRSWLLSTRTLLFCQVHELQFSHRSDCKSAHESLRSWRDRPHHGVVALHPNHAISCEEALKSLLCHYHTNAFAVGSSVLDRRRGKYTTMLKLITDGAIPLKFKTHRLIACTIYRHNLADIYLDVCPNAMLLLSSGW